MRLQLKKRNLRKLDQNSSSQDKLSEVDRHKQMLQENAERLNQTLSELASSQVQLIQAEKFASIGHLAAGAAHEINNPIGFIRSNLQTLNDYLPSALSKQT